MKNLALLLCCALLLIAGIGCSQKQKTTTTGSEGSRSPDPGVTASAAGKSAEELAAAAPVEPAAPVVKYTRAQNIKVVSDKVEDVATIEDCLKSFIKPGMTDEEKALAIWTACVKFRHQWGPPREYLPECVHDPIKTFNVYGYGMCCCVASNIEGLARAAGLQARGRGINCHSVPEVFYDNDWHLLDASLICWFRDKDGAIASVDEIIASVREWYDANPGYEGQDAKLREYMRGEGWKKGPAVLATSLFYDANGWLPAGTHGWYSTVQEYDGSNKFEYEYGYSQGYRCLMTLRQNETLARNWSNTGRHINRDGGGDAPLTSVPGAGDMRYSPQYGDIAPGRVGSAEQQFKLDVSNPAWMDGVESAENLKVVPACAGTPAALAVDNPNAPGILVVKMQSPYVVLAASIQGRLAGGSLTVAVSTNNGLDYTEVSNAQGSEFEISLTDAAFRRYTYYVKLTLSGKGAALHSLELWDERQCSQRALPALAQGTNTITVSATPGLATMTVEGNTNPEEKHNETWRTFHGEVKDLVDKPGIWITAQYDRPAPDRHGYLTFPVKTKGAMKVIRGGGSFRARNKGAGVKLEASFDNGQTWKQVVDAPGPYAGLGAFGELTDIPAGTTSALVRYHMYGQEPTGVLLYRFDIDYEEGSSEGIMPFDVVYTWTENGTEKTNVQTITTVPAEYTIEVATKPMMKSILLRPAEEK